MMIADFVQIYKLKLNKLIRNLKISELQRVIKLLKECEMLGGTVYLAGNGGSASTCSHFVCDLVKGTKPEHSFKAVCLSDNIPLITAYGNDVAYDNIFAKQIECISEKDLLIVMSASGNSKNLVNAVQVASSKKVQVIGILGFDGGILYKLCDTSILVKSVIGDYAVVEDLHLIVCHILAGYLKNEN